MFRHTRNIAASGVLLLLMSCTSQPTAPVRVSGEPMPETLACISSLVGRSDAALPELDSTGIEVVNWNIQKGRNTEWAGDLAAENMGPDLLILQEASRKTVVWQDLVPDHHSSFAEGFGPDWSPSGVMTVSAAAPITECKLVAHEPWFGTRKATLITEYGLSGTDRTLLVANIHGINFTLGVSDLAKQFEQVRAVIDEHDGPVVVSGDFNTWRSQRTVVLEEMLATLGLTALEFDVDHRKRFLGWALDHIYVRGLDSEYATTMSSTASDHNPMAVRLRLTDDEPRVRAAR
jgi:endonuclease/exonuclease/phosphatase (EEP) superfamily protein YafD